MINWLFGKPKPKQRITENGAEQKPMRWEPIKTVPTVPTVRRILSVEKAKKSDEMITIGNLPRGSCKDSESYSGAIEQYIRREFGNWFHYPSLDKVEGTFSPYEKMYESYQIRKDYPSDEPLLAIAIKARKSPVKCIYCHSEIEHKAQVCLDCGGFLCLECAPTQEKCPTLGCK